MGRQNPPPGRGQQQTKGLALAGRANAPNLVSAPQKLELVAVRSGEGLARFGEEVIAKLR